MVFTAENRILQGLLLGAIELLVAGCVRHAAPTPPKPAVTVVNLHAGRVSLTTELPGRTSAYRVAEVRPQVNGVVLKRLFKEGDLVAASSSCIRSIPHRTRRHSRAHEQRWRMRAPLSQRRGLLRSATRRSPKRMPESPDYDNASRRCSKMRRM